MSHHHHHSVDAHLRQVRADTLARIKGILQPLFDNETITRDEFVAICKQSLRWAMSSESFREAATQETLRPLIEAQLKAIGRSPMMPITPNSKRTLFPSRHTEAVSRLDENNTFPKPSKRPEPRMMQQTTPSINDVAIEATDATRSQAQDLMERYFLHDDHGVGETRGTSLPTQLRTPAGVDHDEGGHGGRTGPQFASSCSSGPIDPDDVLYRQRQQRLATLRRQRQLAAVEAKPSNQSLDATSSDDRAQRAPTAFSNMDALAALLERHHAIHTELLQRHLDGMERRNGVLLEEHNERQFVALDEVAAWGLLLTSSERDVYGVAHRERDHLEHDEVRYRDELLQSEVALMTSIRDLCAVELRSIEEAAEVARHLLEQNDDALDSAIPPPPTTPKPARQFESDRAEEDGRGNTRPPTDAEEVQFALLQRLKEVAAHLPAHQRGVVAERIRTLETQLASRVGKHESATEAMGHSATPKRRTIPLELSPEVLPRVTPRRVVATMDPYAPVHAVSPHLLAPKTPPVRAIQPRVMHPSSRSPTASRKTPKPSSMATGRIGLEKPTRAQVVEFLRRLLQPLYDSESLPRDMFVGIVKHISHKFFHNDQWLGLAEKTVGSDVVAQHLRHPLMQPPLWQVYLHWEVSGIVGEDVVPL